MLTNTCDFNISEEFLICRWNNGVKLISVKETATVEINCSSPRLTLSALMKKPLNFYISNTESYLYLVNEQTAMTCGYLSEKDARGKSVRDISKKDTANMIIANDRNIIKTQTYAISEENFTRHDDRDLNAISIKFPLYKDTNLIGILGCSILIGFNGVPSLADSLSILMETGLMNTNIHGILPGKQYHGIYFTKIENDILRYLVRGKSAKEIAKILGYSFRTIEHRLETIKIKSNVVYRKN